MQVRTMNETRSVILEMVRDQLDLDADGFEKLSRRGRLDELTAVDSLLMVDLVVSLEERFSIRFEPDDIDAELMGDITRLCAFVDMARQAE